MANYHRRFSAKSAEEHLPPIDRAAKAKRATGAHIAEMLFIDGKMMASAHLTNARTITAPSTNTT